MNENNGNGASGRLQFDEEMCERYIYGELSPADQERFEETYFSDDAFFERYIAVKTELLDLLARGELSSEKRSRMEPHFQATPPRRQRVEDSALFTTSVTAVARRRSPRATALVALATENDGFIAGLFRPITAFLTSPRPAAFTVLLIAVGGGLYLLNRSSSTDMGREIAVQVPSEAGPPRRDEAPVSPDVAAEETVSGDEPASRTDPSSNRSTDDERSAADTYPGIRGSRKTAPAPGQKMPPSPTPGLPVRDRASTGSALTLSTVGRDNGRDAVPGEGLTQSVVLRSGATRGQGLANTLVLRSDNDQNWVNINLIFSGDSYPNYVITITDVQGNIVLKENDLKEQKKEDGNRTVSLWIDETSMFENRNRDYIAILQGQTSNGKLETIEEYYFHVRRVDKIPPPGKKL